MMKKNKLKRIFYSLTGASVVYSGVNSILNYKSQKVAQSSDKSNENEIGYEDISLLNNFVHTNNFVIFHIEKNCNISKLEQKIKFCQENDISIGLVLDTEAEKLTEMYEDIDMLQAIVKEYNI